MPIRQPDATQTRSEQLMEIAIALAEFSRSPELLRGAPGYLRERLAAERVTLALARDTPVGPEIIMNLSATTGGVHPGHSPRAEELLTLYFKTRPVSESHGPVFCPAGDTSSLAGGASAPTAGDIQPTVLIRQLDAGIRMLLIFHPRPEQYPFSAEDLESLNAIAHTLALLLESMSLWLFRSDAVDTPFKALTPREWSVLRELHSGAGEKELASRLQMSPHTFHSHVKAIYRKVGVPGRLPLMLKVEELLREQRLAKLEKRLGTSSRNNPTNRPALSV